MSMVPFIVLLIPNSIAVKITYYYHLVVIFAFMNCLINTILFNIRPSSPNPKEIKFPINIA